VRAASNINSKGHESKSLQNEGIKEEQKEESNNEDSDEDEFLSQSPDSVQIKEESGSHFSNSSISGEVSQKQSVKQEREG